jgi:alginate O-acetyltransferase complex protein AlgJ
MGFGGWTAFVENRQLANFPWSQLRAGEIGATARGIEAFFSDHFALRQQLIYAVNRAKLAMNAVSTPIVRREKSGWVFLQDLAEFRDLSAAQPVEAVILGKDRWMFLNDLTDYRGLTVTQPATIDSWRRVYISRKRFVTGLGAHFLLVIAPQKATIYPEYLPNYAQRMGTHTRRNEYLKAMQGSSVRLLDLSTSVRKAKPSGHLYYKYDTHWNFLGAYFGARAIINYMHSLFPNVPKFSDRSFTTTPLVGQTQTYGDEGWYNLGVRIGVPFLKDEDERIERIGGWTTHLQVSTERRHMRIYTYTKDDPSLPTIVVYADSFGYPLKRMIAEYFRRSVFVNPFEDERTLPDEFPADIIERERPDYFIYLRWEHAAFAPAQNPSEVRRFTSTRP